MSRNKPQTTEAPKYKPTTEGFLDLPRVAGIRALIFDSKTPINIPGAVSASSVSDREYKKGGRHSIEFVPQLRSFLVTFYGTNIERILVHESVPLNVMLPTEVVESAPK